MDFLDSARMLLDMTNVRRAEILGTALRLAYTLSGGTAELLAGTALERGAGKLTLFLREGTGVFAGESVTRRLDRLAQALDLEAATRVTTPGGPLFAA
jgi:exopolyphosphatase/guanosine-5'-triphosphate,3'-diphosphate pyrophosphatase